MSFRRRHHRLNVSRTKAQDNAQIAAAPPPRPAQTFRGIDTHAVRSDMISEWRRSQLSPVRDDEQRFERGYVPGTSAHVGSVRLALVMEDPVEQRGRWLEADQAWIDRQPGALDPGTAVPIVEWKGQRYFDPKAFFFGDAPSGGGVYFVAVMPDGKTLRERLVPTPQRA